MNQQLLLQLIRDSIELTLIVSFPVLASGLLVGIAISIIQVVTSIQDATLSFVPRIVVMLVISLLLLSWMVEKVVTFTVQLFNQFPSLAS